MKNSWCNFGVAAMAVWILALSVCALPQTVQAAIPLEAWRSEVVSVRTLAENDAPLARKEALRLQKNLPFDATPADKARVLNLLARIEVYTAQPGEAAIHAQQALNMAKQNADRVGQAEAYLSISLNAVNSGKIDAMLDAAPLALDVLQGVDRPDLVSEAMLRVAMMYRRIGQEDASVTLCMQTMDVAKRSNDPWALLYAHYGLGISYEQSGRHAEAREHFVQMRDLARVIHAKQFEADAMGGIADALGNQGDLSAAISMQREAIALYRSIGVPFNIGHGLFALATNLRQQGRLADSLQPLGEAVDIYEHSPNKIGLWWTLNARSENLQTLGRLASARADAERAYVLAQNIGLLLYRSESARRMAAVNSASGDYKRAYQFSAEAADLAGKMTREKGSARMVELAQRYQNESKQKKIDELSLHVHQRVLEKHWLLTVLGGSLLFLAGATFFLLRLRRSQHLLVVSNTQLRQSQDEVNALNVGLEHRVQAQTAELRQQTRYLRALIDTLPVSIWLKDTGGRYLAVNASTAATSSVARIGYAPEQMIGKTDEELWPGDATRSVSVRDIEVMQTRQHKTYEIAIPGEDGSIAWREVDKAPVIDEDGSVLGTVGFARDISERKRYEQVLLERAELERRQSYYFAMVSGIFATVLKRADGSYSIPFISDGVRDLYGLEPDAVMRDIMVFAALAHPEDAEMTFRKADESARDLNPYRVEYRINHPSKGIRWIECRSTPQRMPDGGTRWDGFYFDITERKRTEEVLRFIAQGEWLNSGEIFLNALVRYLGQMLHVDYVIIDKVAADSTYAETVALYAKGEVVPNMRYRLQGTPCANVMDGNLCSYPENVQGQFPEDGLLVEMQAESYAGLPLWDTNGKVIGLIAVLDGKPMGDENQVKSILQLVATSAAAELKRSQMEQVLRESHESLHEAQRIAHVGSWELNLVDNILTWSEEIYRIFEIDPQQFGATYEAFMHTVHPDDRELVDSSYKASLEKRERFEFEHRLLLPDGRIKYVFECCESYYDDNGKPLRSLGTVQDITERKLMEKSLIESEREFRSLTENLPDNIARWDVEGRILHSNSIHQRSLGKSVIELIGKTHREAFPDGRYDPVDAGIAQVVATGQAALFVRQPVSFENGETEIHDVKLVPERDAVGKIISVLGVGRNMTDLYRLQDDLKASEQQLRALAESSPGMMGAFYARPDGSICMPYVSANIEDLFGLRPQDLAVDAAPLMALNHPADAQRVKESIAESARTMTVWHEEYRIFHPTKGLRWMESNTMPTPHPEGGVIWYGHVHDITERKRIESVLRRSQEMLIDAQKLALLGSWDWYLVTNRVEWSEMAYEIYTPDKRPAEPDFEDFKSSLHPDDLERVVAAVQSAFDHDTPFDLDHRVVSVSKGVRSVHAQGTVFRDTNGKPVRMVGTVQDITVRKQLESDLRASRNFLDTVIKSVSDPIFVKDRQHRWTLLNDAFCTFIGLSRETLLGKSDYDFFPEEQADEFWAKDEFVFNAGQINLNEENFTAASGEEHYIQTKKTPFVSGDGDTMLVGVIRDITNLKRYEAAREAALDEALRLAKTRSEFLAHMSHELRTPLNGILGYTQILQKDKSLSARNADALNVIRQGGEHLLRLVEDILDLARIEAGRFKLDLSDISLATFLRVVTDIVSVRAQQKGLAFTSDLAADLPAGIRGDDKRLRQVLLNLLSNAVKFTDHGRVVLHVSRVSPSRLAFVIEDTGVGIAADELEAIFQPFEQSGDAQQRLGGAGLGLSISRQLVRLMGGDIVVESRIGEGSTFRFELELPAVEVASGALLSALAGNERAEPEGKDEPLILPSAAEMQTLHRLAQLGNMRDIVQYAERIAGIDPRYQPFAARLRRMAEGFQSKAILAFVEQHVSL